MDNKILEIKNFNIKLNTYKYGIAINTYIDDTIEDWTDEMFDNIYHTIATPKQFIQQQGGVCWDYTLYEAWYFTNYYSDISYKTWYIDILCKNNFNINSHTFLTFYLDNIYYYIESSYKKIAGIYSSNKEENILNFVIYNMNKDNINLNYTATILNKKFEIHQFTAMKKQYWNCNMQNFMYYCNNEYSKLNLIYNKNFNIKKL